MKRCISLISCFLLDLLPDNNWPELLLFLYQCVSSSSNKLKESTFSLFRQLAKDINNSPLLKKFALAIHKYTGWWHLRSRCECHGHACFDQLRSVCIESKWKGAVSRSIGRYDEDVDWCIIQQWEICRSTKKCQPALGCKSLTVA